MTFQLNGDTRPWRAGLSVACMLQEQGYGVASREVQTTCGTEGIRTGIALAINECVIPRSQWQSVVIQPDDQVDLFTAIAGG